MSFYTILIVIFIVAVILAYRVDFKKNKKEFIYTAIGTLAYILFYIIKSIIQ